MHDTGATQTETQNTAPQQTKKWIPYHWIAKGDNNQESHIPHTIHRLWPHDGLGGTPNYLAGIPGPTTKKTAMGFQTLKTSKQWPTDYPSHPEWPHSGSE